MIADLSPNHRLAELDLLQGLSAPALDDVAAHVRLRAHARGTTLFDQGEPTSRAHALLSGGVRISQSGSDGGQAVIRFIGPGEIFGSVAIYTDQRYPADAVAMSDCTEASWTQGELIELMERHPRIAINMIAITGRRLADLQNRVRELATQSAERRVANTVLRLARQAGRPSSTGIVIEFPLRRKDIADISGTTLHTVSRILTKWAKQGLISSNRRELTLCAIAEIDRIAES